MKPLLQMTESESAAWSARGWERVCLADSLHPDRPVAALVDGRQVAIVKVTGSGIFALDNLDPFSKANVMARGLVGDSEQTPVLISPMYKQRFDLRSGQCLDDPDVAITVHQVRIVAGYVEVAKA